MKKGMLGKKSEIFCFFVFFFLIITLSETSREGLKKFIFKSLCFFEFLNLSSRGASRRTGPLADLPWKRNSAILFLSRGASRRQLIVPFRSRRNSCNSFFFRLFCARQSPYTHPPQPALQFFRRVAAPRYTEHLTFYTKSRRLG